MGPILGFLKLTKVDERQGAREREKVYEQRNNHMEEELLTQIESS